MTMFTDPDRRKMTLVSPAWPQRCTASAWQPTPTRHAHNGFRPVILLGWQADPGNSADLKFETHHSSRLNWEPLRASALSPPSRAARARSEPSRGSPRSAAAQSR
jgi:hypothetical protein